MLYFRLKEILPSDVNIRQLTKSMDVVGKKKREEEGGRYPKSYTETGEG